MAGRRRVDAELVRRQLADSRAQAADLIARGRVLVGGVVADKPSRLVSPAEPVTVVGPPPAYVSRGGDKLAAALDAFAIDVAGKRALDAGASTGGFTDCLLQRGAASVVAVDVGRGQLHERLRGDGRVTVRERTDVRDVTPDEPFDVVVADLSFISLRTVAPALTALAGPGADLVVLVKPQFEAGRQAASRGKGVIRDPELWREAIVAVIDALGAAGAAMMGVMASPLRGADGNAEFLVHLKLPPHGGPADGRDGLVDRAVADATAAGD